jgi:hypothetical protein
MFIGLSTAFIIFSAILLYLYLSLYEGIKKAIYIPNANVVVILYAAYAHSDVNNPIVYVDGAKTGSRGDILFGVIAYAVAQAEEKPLTIVIQQRTDAMIYGKERLPAITMEGKKII